MGCSQTRAADVVPSEVQERLRSKSALANGSHSRLHVTKATADGVGNCAVLVRDEVFEECDEPVRTVSFHSWNHEVDHNDLKMMNAGHSLPINKTAHCKSLSKMTKALTEIMKDPNDLDRLVRQRRAACEYQGAGAVEAPTSARPRDPVARPIRPGHSLPRAPVNVPVVVRAGTTVRVSV